MAGRQLIRRRLQSNFDSLVIGDRSHVKLSLSVITVKSVIMSEPTAAISLYDLLSNSLILLSICPLLSLPSILALTATSKAISSLLWETPQVFKRLDLSTRVVRHQNSEGYNAAQTSGYNMHANYAFFWYAVSNCFDRLARKTKLQGISTMILDGLPVTQLVLDVITESLNVRLLSIRGITNLSDWMVQNHLLSLVSPSHPDLKLKGLYYFGPADGSPIHHATAGSLPPASANTGMMSTPGAQLGAHAPTPSKKSASISGEIGWFDGNGEVPLPGLGEQDMRQSWEITIKACAGIIALDIISCRRCPMRVDYKINIPRLANISLKGCKICGSCPEGPAYVGKSPESFLPLLAPLPLYSSTVKVAQIPPSEALSVLPLIARCEQCLQDRWCRNCNAWWCESCYKPPARVLGKDEKLQVISGNGSIKVHLGLCVENCLVS